MPNDPEWERKQKRIVKDQRAHWLLFHDSQTNALQWGSMPLFWTNSVLKSSILREGGGGGGWGRKRDWENLCLQSIPSFTCSYRELGGRNALWGQSFLYEPTLPPIFFSQCCLCYKADRRFQLFLGCPFKFRFGPCLLNCITKSKALINYISWIHPCVQPKMKRHSALLWQYSEKFFPNVFSQYV